LSSVTIISLDFSGLLNEQRRGSPAKQEDNEGKVERDVSPQ
jgi:hypothetical protein